MSKAKKPVSKLPKGQTVSARSIRLVLAGYLTMILLFQLFAFEKMPVAVSDAGVPAVWASVLVACLVVLELLALPFLIGMKLPRPASLLSCISVFVGLFLLAVLEVIMFLDGDTIIFGAVFDLPGGSWSLLFVAALLILAVWGIWGDKLNSTQGEFGKKTLAKLKTTRKGRS